MEDGEKSELTTVADDNSEGFSSKGQHFPQNFHGNFS